MSFFEEIDRKKAEVAQKRELEAAWGRTPGNDRSALQLRLGTEAESLIREVSTRLKMDVPFLRWRGPDNLYRITEANYLSPERKKILESGGYRGIATWIVGARIQTSPPDPKYGGAGYLWILHDFSIAAKGAHSTRDRYTQDLMREETLRKTFTKYFMGQH